MKKKSRDPLLILSVIYTIAIILLICVGEITELTVIKQVLNILVIISASCMFILLCIVFILCVICFCIVQKEFKYIFRIMRYLDLLKYNRYKSYFEGYSADKMATIEKEYNNKISDAERWMTYSINLCQIGYIFLSRKQRQAVNDIVKSRESSRV